MTSLSERLEDDSDFKLGDIVETSKGASFWGEIIAFDNDGKSAGCTVLAIAPGFEGTKHVYPLKQLRIRSALAAGPVAVDGWKLVPVEPTEAMIEAHQAACGGDADEAGPERIRECWTEMLAASPGASLTAGVEPFLYGIRQPNGKPLLDEECVWTGAGNAKDAAEDLGEGYEAVALYALPVHGVEGNAGLVGARQAAARSVSSVNSVSIPSVHGVVAITEALRPFARIADEWDAIANDGHVFADSADYHGHGITVGDLRRARSVLRAVSKTAVGDGRPDAFVDETGIVSVPEWSRIKALLDALPKPPVGKKVLPLYARPNTGAADA